MTGWHRDLPPGTEEVWDMIAKALLLRAGGAQVSFSVTELEAAGKTPCEIQVTNAGVHFRVEPT